MNLFFWELNLCFCEFSISNRRARRNTKNNNRLHLFAFVLFVSFVVQVKSTTYG
jgi:hypothetical protein